MLKAVGVSVVKNKRILLDGINIAIEPGELLVLLGPNGAGKSTLLKCLAGNETQSFGQVSLDNQSLDTLSMAYLSRRRAVLSQSTFLAFPFTVMEVLQMAVQSTQTIKEIECLCLDALGKMAVASFAHVNYQDLSGGERQRVQIARALVQLGTSQSEEAQYLLLDEPTSALDLKHQTELMKLLSGLTKEGIGILCVLHDLQLAAQYADRVVLMQQGRIVVEGAPATQLTHRNVLDVYHVLSHVVAHPTSGRPMVLLD